MQVQSCPRPDAHSANPGVDIAQSIFPHLAGGLKQRLDHLGSVGQRVDLGTGTCMGCLSLLFPPLLDINSIQQEVDPQARPLTRMSILPMSLDTFSATSETVHPELPAYRLLVAI